MGWYKGVIRGHDMYGSKLVNVFYWSCDFGGSQVVAAIGAFFEDWITLHRATIPSSTEYEGYDTYDWSPDQVWRLIDQHTRTGGGAASGNQAPPQVSPILIAKTGTNRCRAKKALWAPLVSILDNGNAGTSLLSAMGNLLALWIGEYTNGGTTIYPVVWRKKQHVGIQITGGQADSILGTMRSRKIGKGV